MGSVEADVGITCWANDAPGFTGILKERFSDFQVNEVGPDGTIVTLEPIHSSDAAKLPVDVHAKSNAATAEKASQAAESPAADTSAANDPEPSPAQVAPAAANGAEQLHVIGSAAPDNADVACAADEAPEHINGSRAAAEAMQEAVEREMQGLAPRLAEFAALAGPDSAEPLAAFLRAALAYQLESDAAKGDAAPGCPPPLPAHLAPLADKEQRRAVHLFLQKPWGLLPGLVTEAVDSGAAGQGEGPNTADGASKVSIIIRVSLPSGQGKDHEGRRKRERSEGRGAGRGGRGRKRAKPWGGGPPSKYTRFVLAKQNLDTQAALGLLARFLHCGVQAFSTAGTKDKRAVTVQRVTANNIAPERLEALNPRLRGMRVGGFEGTEEQMELGALRGNHFRIILRNLESQQPGDVRRAMEALQRSGFINYFGLQRFGSGSSPTHRVGAALLRGEWEAAVRLIMAPREGERPENEEGRRLYLEEGNIEGALRLLQPALVAERAVLSGLRRMGGKGPAAFHDALAGVPRTMRMMYCHAYQSYLWNAAASHRIATYGLERAVTGDLVLPSGAVVVPPAGSEEEATAGLGGMEGMERSIDRLAAVHVVTQEEAAAGTFSIEDVVLPLVGSRARLPEHATARVFEEIAARDGVPIDGMGSTGSGAANGSGMGGNGREYSLLALQGDYRRVLHRPRDLSWRLLRYEAPQQQLAETLFERLEEPPVEVDSEAVPEGKRVALELRVTLGPSCYATMLLREALKAGTSTGLHRARTLQDGQATGEGVGGAKAGDGTVPEDSSEGDDALAACTAEG